MKISIKSGRNLSESDYLQIKEAFFREFKEGPNSPGDLSNHKFFLLKEGEKILALGGLIPVKPVTFRGKIFNIVGIGGILANEKRKGYGKKIMTSIRRYLILHHETGVGFCGERNIQFYEKCGFNIDRDSITRFIHHENGKRISNGMKTTTDFVVYLDSDDHFMKKVQENSSEDIILPRPPNW